VTPEEEAVAHPDIPAGVTSTVPDGRPPEDDAGSAAVTAEDLAKVQAALDKERDLRKAAEKEAKEGRQYKAKIDEIESASKPELERAVQAARREAAAEATAKANSRLVTSEARALAAEARFRNPATAVRLLDLSEVSVTDSGEVDTDAIKSALSKLGEDEPYLLADESGRTPPARDAGIGVAGSGTPTDDSPRSLIAAGLSKTTRQ
jgi:hypothetical protein